MVDLTNKVVTPITLAVDTSLGNRPAYIYAKQNDVNSRYIVVTVTNCGKKIPVTGVAILNATLPNGQAEYVTGEPYKDGTIVVELKSSLLSLVGNVACDITIHASDSEQSGFSMTTSTFYIIVDKTNFDPSAIESSEDMSVIGEILAQISDDRAAIEEAKEDIEAASSDLKEIFPSVQEFTSRVETIERQLADLLYTPITIKNFTHGYTGALERGVKITDVTLKWATNKTPTVLSLDGQEIDPNATEHHISGLEITWDNCSKVWKLTATGERENDSVTESTSRFVFYNGIYYGVVDADAEITDEVIRNLKRLLRGSISVDFTVSPTAGQRIIFACPSRMGTPIFNIRKLDYEWDRVAASLPFENSSEYTEPYDVWKSCQDIAGSISVNVYRKEE